MMIMIMPKMFYHISADDQADPTNVDTKSKLISFSPTCFSSEIKPVWTS